jgi:hypothetical protein
MRNKLLILLSLLVIGAMALAACGGGHRLKPRPHRLAEAEEAAPTEAPAAEEAAPTEAPAAEEAAAHRSAGAAPAADTGVSLTIWADEQRAPILECLGRCSSRSRPASSLVVVQKAIGDIRS